MKKRIKSHKWIFSIYTSLQSIRNRMYKMSFRLITIVFSVCDNLFDYIPIKNDTGIYKIIYSNPDNRGNINCWFENIKNHKDVVELKGKYHKWLSDSVMYYKRLYFKLDFKRWFLTNWEYVNSKTHKSLWKELNKIDWPSVLSWKLKVVNLSDYLDLWSIDVNELIALYNNTDKDFTLTINFWSKPDKCEKEIKSWMPFISWLALKYTLTITIK